MYTDNSIMYNSVVINKNHTHYVHTCLGNGIPEVTLRLISDNSIQFVLEDNHQLYTKLQDKRLPRLLYTSVDLPGGFTAPVKMMLPPGLDEKEQRKYPALVHVYGGPHGHQQVDHRNWGVGWADYLTTSRDIVYIRIDGRGSGYQSDELLFQVYRKLGDLEIKDQITSTRQLLSRYSFLDPNRTAIWGGSYGGYATLMALEQDDGPDPVFSCGISVAPVTNWLQYRSDYTERYMGLPSDNAEGYKNSSAISRIENLRHKKLMLNHGVADDNVHNQHTMLLTKALQKADIQYQEHSYPDQDHNLNGYNPTTRNRFLYHAMDEFWTDCFGFEPTNNTTGRP